MSKRITQYNSLNHGAAAVLNRLVAVAAASAATSAAEAPLGATAGVIAAAARAASGEAGQVRLARDWRFEARRPEAGKSWYGATSVGSGVFFLNVSGGDWFT